MGDLPLTAPAQPSVTVVIPTRNRLELLRNAVASLRGQTLRTWELVVVDDASEDGTWAWLSSLADDQIRPLRLKRHSERSYARNHGLAEARGAAVLFLDDDDVLRPAALEVLTRALAGSPGAVAAIGARATISSDGQRTNVRHAKRGQTRHIWPEVLLLWFSAWFSVPGQILFRVSALRAVDGWRRELIVGEDWELQLRLSRLGPTVLVPDVVFEWRLHGGQWRPRDTEVVEDRNRRRFVDGLSGRERELGARVLRARELLVLAEEHHILREFGRSFLLTAHAARTVPAFLVSPLTGHAFRRLLAASLLGAVVGRRGFGALKRTRRLGHRALGRELPEYRAIPSVGTSRNLTGELE